MTEHLFNLPDGRNLGYAVFGPGYGRPVLYFHGTPSSRLEVQLLRTYHQDPEQHLHEEGLRLIAVDRPGMGLSSFHPGATLLSFAQDVLALMQHLNLPRCPVMCWSGGGPYALAIAWQYPRLISSVYIICGFTQRFTPDVVNKMHLNRWYFRAAKHLPTLLESALNSLRNIHTRHAIPRWLTGLPEPDYNLLRQPHQWRTLARVSVQEACHRNARGAVQDAQIYFQPFGFRISELTQPVHYWWGTEDTSVIGLHADAIAKQVKHGTVHLKEGEGHLSIYIKYFREVLHTIATG